MLITILIVLNIPIFLLIGWLVFDTTDSAADSFLGTIVALLKIIFLPPALWSLMGEEEGDGAWGLVPVAMFFIACGAIVYGEHYLITKYLFA